MFVQVLRLCQVAGLVKLGHVAVDGTKKPRPRLARSPPTRTDPAPARACRSAAPARTSPPTPRRTRRNVTSPIPTAVSCRARAASSPAAERRVRAYLSPGRIRHGETDPAAGRVLISASRVCRPWPRPFAGPVGEVDTGCASRSSSRCPDRSSRLEAPTVPPSRSPKGPGRGGDGLHRPQPPQAAQSNSVRRRHSPASTQTPINKNRAVDHCRTSS